MGSIIIQDHRLAGATLLPDTFVDYFMPRANGEFVKIFLYLLRSVHAPNAYPTLSSLADVFSCTEKDVLRALRYWEKAGLLKLNFKDKELEEIVLLPIQDALAATSRTPETSDFPSAPAERAALPADTEKDAVPSGVEGAAAAVPSGKESESRPSGQITTTRLRELKNDEDARTITMVAETYLGRTLSTTDLQHLLYFYDELHFPENLVEYLVEYCVSRGKRSMHYIETVGFAWYKEGIMTLKDAKAKEKTGKKNYYTIFRAFGIRNRDPIPEEIATMDRWINEYGFSTDLIAEAASRTIRNVHEPNFQYAEGILSRWHKAGVKTLEDIQARDEQHKAEQKASDAKKKKTSSGSVNRFNTNFQSRDYDYDQLEQDLLNSPDT